MGSVKRHSGLYCGGLGVGRFTDRFGRKATLIVTAILFTISAIGSALANDLTVRCLPHDWRIGSGHGISCNPLYIAEVSPKDLRGRMLGMQQMLMVGAN